MRRYILSSAMAVLALAPDYANAQAQAARQPAAAAADTAFFRGMRYRLVGPSRGGRVTAVTGVPSQPRTFYMGVASGGLFRTTDGGVNWMPITDGKVPVGSMGAIAVADSDPNTIYLGTGSDGLRSNVSTGRGVYKTTDGGQTWQFAGLYNSGQIGAVRIHPTNTNIVWVSATGDAFKKNTERGVFKTIDGGRNWKRVLFLSDSVGAMDVEVQPGNPNVVYAWMSRLERKPWTIISGSREGGFYKSTDGGETFNKISTGLPTQLIGKGNLAVTAANPNRIYALIEAKPGGGLYRSDDAGQSWTQVNSTGGLIQRPFYYTTLGADPTNADIVYAGAEGFYKSVDGGRTMQSMSTPHGDNHDIWVNPTDGNTMVQANDGGANVSFDGGRTWSTQQNQVTEEFYGVWVDNQFPYKLYAAQQDNSTIITSSHADPFDRAAVRGGPGCETGPILPHPKNPNYVYGSCKGQYEWMNLETGITKQYWVGGQSLYGNDAKNLILRFQRVSPMATSPHDPEILYYGSQHVHRTRNKGVTWETISPDLTANPPCCQGGSGEPITRDVTGEEFYSTLYAITESPHEAGVIWTGSNDGPFYITRNHGRSWTNITPKDLPTGGRVQWIDASPHRRGSAYYAVYRYLLGDYQPYIYKTEDYGATWTRLTDGKNGIPADWPTRVVREDPDRAGLLYAGTEFGMFISFDNGTSWQSFHLNMPHVPITDIKVHRKDLIVSTQGRGIYIFDNLSAIQQLVPQTASSAQPRSNQPYLFKPRDGYRTRVGADLLGPMVEYFLPSAPTGPVTIEILDPAGALVSTYNSETPVAAAGGGGRGGRGGGGGGGRGAAGAAGAAGGGRAGRAGGGGAGAGGDAGAAANVDPDMMAGRPQPTGRGGAVASRVTKNVGMNRFVWDMRHQNGLTAPPGQYQVQLKVGAATLKQPMNVLLDPRLVAEGMTAADLKVLFDHQIKARELVADVGRVVTRVQQAQTRLRTATGAAAADSLAKVNAIVKKLLDEQDEAGRNIRYGNPGLRTHITYMNGMTGGADQHPGNDAIARYTVLRKELDAIKTEVDRVLGPQPPGGGD